MRALKNDSVVTGERLRCSTLKETSRTESVSKPRGNRVVSTNTSRSWRRCVDHVCYSSSIYFVKYVIFVEKSKADFHFFERLTLQVCIRV